jgi:hypothetical protein
MKPKTFKPVRAFALVSGDNGGFYAYWTFDRKPDLTDPNTFHRVNSTPKRMRGDRWIPVLITPITPPKRRKAETKK